MEARSFTAHRERLSLIVVLVLLPLVLAACATSAPPLPQSQRVALTPERGRVTLLASKGQLVGQIVPVDISIANGTEEPRLVVPSQVFALNEHGQRIMAVPATEAIREAGSANALKAGISGAAKNAAIGTVAGAVIGAALGTALGAVVGAPGTGAAYGAAMGGGVGLAEGGVLGGMEGQAASYRDAASQISSLSLQAAEVQPNFSVNGYVFFPEGKYDFIEMIVVNEETHGTDTLRANLP